MTRRIRKFLAPLVLATAGLLVLQGAAVAQNGNSRPTFRAAGSDTTYDVTLRLCSLFNQAPASIRTTPRA
jgi:hypothetical protein